MRYSKVSLNLIKAQLLVFCSISLYSCGFILPSGPSQQSRWAPNTIGWSPDGSEIIVSGTSYVHYTRTYSIYDSLGTLMRSYDSASYAPEDQSAIYFRPSDNSVLFDQGYSQETIFRYYPALDSISIVAGGQIEAVSSDGNMVVVGPTLYANPSERWLLLDVRSAKPRVMGTWSDDAGALNASAFWLSPTTFACASKDNRNLDRLLIRDTSGRAVDSIELSNFTSTRGLSPRYAVYLTGAFYFGTESGIQRIDSATKVLKQFSSDPAYYLFTGSDADILMSISVANYKTIVWNVRTGASSQLTDYPYRYSLSPDSHHLAVLNSGQYGGIAPKVTILQVSAP